MSKRASATSSSPDATRTKKTKLTPTAEDQRSRRATSEIITGAAADAPMMAVATPIATTMTIVVDSAPSIHAHAPIASQSAILAAVTVVTAQTLFKACAQIIFTFLGYIS
jgi:hypothetical protein